MDNTLPVLYSDYGKYSNWRNMPLDIDGLKPVERRVLLSAYKIARTKFVKSRQVDAYTIGHYHPHGECITGDTEILLLDGSTVKIEDLVNKESFWVYSCTPEGVIKPGLGHSARVTKKVTTLYKLYFNNNTSLECTGNHLLMLRDGTYIKAKDIKVNDSLMPLNIRQEDGYTYYKDNSRTICREEKVAWMVVRELINNEIDNLIGFRKFHVHHKNSIRSDDRPENLDLIYYKDHCSETAKNRSSLSNRIISEKVSEAFSENKNNFQEKALAGLEKGRKKMFSEDSPIREKIRQKNSLLITEYNKRYVEDRILKILSNMLNDNIEINKQNYEIYRKKIYNGPLWRTIFKKFNSLEEAITIAKNYNHKVVKIEIINLDEPIKVYDISVEKYHNFAIKSGIFIHNCYGSVVQLVKQGFLDGQGNFGSNVGVDSIGPAAPRYTECKINNSTIDLAFKYLEYVPWIETELSDIEPVFLPSMFPICLIGNEYTQGIGFGFKTFIPCFKISDLYKRLLWLLGIRKRKPTIRPICDCNILSSQEELEQLLTTGKAKIEVEGIYEINTRNNTVRLKSWPQGKRFESLLNKFSKELNENMIGFTDLSVHETDIVFQVLRDRNRDKIFQGFLEKLSTAVRGFISFEAVFVDINHKVVVKGIDELLLNSYKMFCDINEKMLKSEIDKINDQVEEYNQLELIKGPLSDCIAKKVGSDESINIIENKTKIPSKTIKELFNKYKIHKLLTVNTDTSRLVERQKELQRQLKGLDNFVLDQYGSYK